MAVVPRHVLAGRFRFVRRVEKARAPAWFAIDDDTGRPVVAAVIPQDRAPALAKGVGLTHPHLAGLLHVELNPTLESFPQDVAVRSPSPIAVVEHITGDVLSVSGAFAVEPREDRARQVQAFTAIVSAVSALHRRSVVHGSISPLSVVVGRRDSGPVPLLTQLLMPPMSPFASPERARTGPSMADDVWAMYAILYAVLNDRATLDAVARTGIEPGRWKDEATLPNEGELRDLVERGLRRAPEERVTSIADLEADLVVWLAHEGVRQQTLVLFEPSDRVSAPPAIEMGAEEEDEEENLPRSDPGLDPISDRAGAAGANERLTMPADETYSGVVAHEHAMEEPPAIPSPPPPPPPSDVAPAPRAPGRGLRRARNVVVAAAGLALAFEAFVALGGSHPARSASSGSSSAQPRAAPSTSSIAISAGLTVSEIRSAAVPAPAIDDSNATACATSFFPDGTFAAPQDLSYLCAPVDARTSVKRLYTSLVAGGAGLATEGMKEWAHLEWYELGVYAVIRGVCCPGAAPIALPPSEPPCDPLGPTLDRLSAAAVTGVDFDLRVLGFDKNVICLHGKATSPYRYGGHAYEGGQVAFATFLRRIGRSTAP